MKLKSISITFFILFCFETTSCNLVSLLHTSATPRRFGNLNTMNKSQSAPKLSLPTHKLEFPYSARTSITKNTARNSSYRSLHTSQSFRKYKVYKSLDGSTFTTDSKQQQQQQSQTMKNILSHRSMSVPIISETLDSYPKKLAIFYSSVDDKENENKNKNNNNHSLTYDDLPEVTDTTYSFDQTTIHSSYSIPQTILMPGFTVCFVLFLLKYTLIYVIIVTHTYFERTKAFSNRMDSIIFTGFK